MPEASSNGLTLHYEIFGDAGPPVLLIMGLGAQMVWWPQELCQLLADRGWRVIRFDNRDIGLSSHLDHLGLPSVPRAIARRMARRPVPEAPYTLEDMSDDTAGLLDALGIEAAHIVGASMGGMIAQTLALRHRHKALSLTSIMSHSGRRRHLFGDPRAVRALLKAPADSSRESVIENAFQTLSAFNGAGLPVPPERIHERVSEAFDRSYHPQGAVRQLTAIMASGDRTRALRGLRLPTTVIHGDQDPLVRPQGGRDTARAIPGAELVMIPGMGHNLPQPMWETLADSIEKLMQRAS